MKLENLIKKGYFDKEEITLTDHQIEELRNNKKINIIMNNRSFIITYDNNFLHITEVYYENKN